MKRKLREYYSKLINTGFFMVFGSSIINKLCSFLGNIVVVRILSKTEYGVFTYAWSIYAIIAVVNGLGMDSAILQLCSEQNENREYRNRITSFAVKCGLGIDVIMATGILAIGKLAPLTIPSARPLVLAVSFLPIFTFLYSCCTVILRSQKKNREFALINTLNSALLAIGSVIGAMAFKGIGLVYSQYFAYGTSIVVAIAFMNIKLFDWKIQGIDKKEKKDLFSISIISACNNGLSQLLFLLDVFVLGVIVAEETVLASYKVATQIPTALSFIPNAVVLYIYPYFAEHRDNKYWCMKTYRKVLMGMLIFNTVISGILIVLAPYIITMLYGAKYTDAVACFRVLSITYFVSGTFRTISGNLLVTQRKLKFNLLVAITSGLVNVILDVVLITSLGSIGAALTTLSVVIVSSIMSTIYLVYTFTHIKNRDV